MSDFKAIMYQIQFRLGLRPRRRWGSLQRSPALPRPIAGLRGLLLRGGNGKGGGKRKAGDGKGRGRGREGRGGDETPPLHAPAIHISGYAPSMKPLTVFFCYP